jgi:hypothetical protein
MEESTKALFILVITDVIAAMQADTNGDKNYYLEKASKGLLNLSHTSRR